MYDLTDLHAIQRYSLQPGAITCAVRSSLAALSRTSDSGHDRDNRSRCRRVDAHRRSEPGRSSPNRASTAWVSSSSAAARSSSSRLHSRVKVLGFGPRSGSDSEWLRRGRPEEGGGLASHGTDVPDSLFISCSGSSCLKALTSSRSHLV